LRIFLSNMYLFKVQKIASRAQTWMIFRNILTRVARWYKNPNLGKFWIVLQWKMLVYVFYVPSVFKGIYIVHFVVIWYILWPFGTFVSFWCVVPIKIWQPWFWRLFQKFFFGHTMKSLSLCIPPICRLHNAGPILKKDFFQHGF
jgi:hypothetical protein